MTTENSRADALTPCVHADDPKACYRVRCQLGGKCVDDDMSPRQPAAAPIDDLRQRICKALDLPATITDDEIVTAAELHRYEFRRLFTADVVRGMSTASAPTTKNPDAMTQAVKQLADWLLTEPNDGNPLCFAGPPEPFALGLSRVKMRSVAGTEWTLIAGLQEGWLTAEQRAANFWRIAKLEREEVAREEADEAAQDAPSPADERAALQWTAGTLQEIVSGRWTGAKESDKVSIGSVTKTIAQVLDMADAALGRAANETGAEGAIYQILTEEGAWLDTTREYYERVKSDPALARVVYAAPQPAQADAPASKHAPHDDPFKSSIQGISALLEDMRDDCVARLNVGDADAMVAAAFIMLVRKLVDRAFTESAAQASYDGNHVENHCPECSQYESECECAQADARVGLTDALRRAREELSIVEWENDPPARVTDLLSTIDALIHGAKQ